MVDLLWVSGVGRVLWEFEIMAIANVEVSKYARRGGIIALFALCSLVGEGQDKGC